MVSRKSSRADVPFGSLTTLRKLCLSGEDTQSCIETTKLPSLSCLLTSYHSSSYTALIDSPLTLPVLEESVVRTGAVHLFKHLSISAPLRPLPAVEYWPSDVTALRSHPENLSSFHSYLFGSAHDYP